MDHLEASDGTLAVQELLKRMDKDPARLRDFLRRTVKPLEEAGIVAVSDNTLTLTPDWLPALNESRERNLEIERYKRDMLRYQLQRDAYRDRYGNPQPSTPDRPALIEVSQEEDERIRRGSGRGRKRSPQPNMSQTDTLRASLELAPIGE